MKYKTHIHINKEYILLTYVTIMLTMIAGLEIAKTEPNIQTMSFRSLESLQRQFTYADLIRITNNFERVLGKGGFGKVYHGYIDDTEVAVKVLSLSSVQGYQQFQAEARDYDADFLSFSHKYIHRF